jgi:hypothetical protein
MEVGLANERKRAEKRKAEGTKAEFYVPRPQSAAEIAASRGISEAALHAEFRASMKVHGERIEDRPAEELTVWLIKFVKTLAEDEIRIQAWEELKLKCDVALLLRHLYLFPHSRQTDADVLRGVFRFLEEGLDGLLPKYNKLYQGTSDLFADPKLRLLSYAVPL